MSPPLYVFGGPYAGDLWAEIVNLALFTVSADLIDPPDPRSSVSVRLLGVAVGVLDTNEPRGTRGDAAFVRRGDTRR